MKRCLLISTVLLMVGVVLSGSALANLEPITHILENDKAPLEIISYEAEFKRGGRYTTEGIHHTVSYRNTGSQPIVAVQIGLVSFNVWNNLIDQTGGTSLRTIEVGGEDSGVWVARSSGDFSFLTGVTYVAKVRFEDGAIWKVDEAWVTRQLSEIESSFGEAELSAL